MNIITTDRLTAFFRPFQKAAVYGALSNPFADGFCEGLKESQVATLTETFTAWKEKLVKSANSPAIFPFLHAPSA